MSDLSSRKKVSEQTLLKKVAQLPTELTPERDLWVGIEKAIGHQSQQNETVTSTKKVMPMAWAASVVAAILLTWLSFSPEQTKQTLV